MLTEFKADLHLHTCLSPCADLTMSPSAIVQAAIEKDLALIGICDHNSSENSSAVVKASHGKKLLVLPGMEVTSKEEVHIVALFEKVNQALELQKLIYDNLEGENREEVFGQQVIVDAKGWVLGFNPRLLIGATNISLENIISAIHNYHGLAIAAHIDREGFGIIGQLGFIPPDLNLDALEISSKLKINIASQKFPEYHQYPFIRSSDAHNLDDIGRGTTTFRLKEASFKELKYALKGYAGRGIYN